MLSLQVTQAIVAALAALKAVSAGDPFFIVRHGPLLATRLDPVVSPGQVSGHVHQIVGASSFGPDYTYENSRAAKCTTANVNADLSNYWIPALYRKAGNGTLNRVPLEYTNTYYQARRQPNEPTYEFPPGFRMLAGNPNRISNDPTQPKDNAISYVCLGISGPQTAEFPKQSCPDGLRAQVYFPHCWDGVNNWLAGSAHVAYANGTTHPDGGEACPHTHPKRIMGLFYEFIFKDDYPYVPGARVLATGDDLGYSLHGDFTNGWPEGLFKQVFAADGCDQGFGVDKCPPLAPFVQDASCVPENVVVSEEIESVAALPGNNPLWGSTGPKAPAANFVEKAEFQKIAAPVPDKWKFLGCIKEATSGHALKADSMVSDSMTPSLCINYCAGKGFSYSGVEYSRECYCANDLSGGASATSLITAGCNMPCPGVAYGQGFCGGRSILSLYEYSGAGAVSVGALPAPQLIAPVNEAAPTQIPASGLQSGTVKGDGVFTGYTGPAVGSGATVATTATVQPTAMTTASGSKVATTSASTKVASTGPSSPSNKTSTKSSTSGTSKAGTSSTIGPFNPSGLPTGVLAAEPTTAKAGATPMCKRSRNRLVA